MLSLRLTSNQFVTHLWDIFLPSVTSSSKVRSSQPLVWTQWQPGKPSLFENKTYLYIGCPDCPELVLNASIVRRPLCEFPGLRPAPMYGNPERIQRELKWQSQHFRLFYGSVQLRELLVHMDQAHAYFGIFIFILDFFTITTVPAARYKNYL
jgi:hypothetical protein